MPQSYAKAQEAKALYSELQRIEEKTRSEAKVAYAHPDDEDFEEQLEAGREEHPKIITQFGRWAVTAYGIECLSADPAHYYPIDAQALHNDWIAQLSEKFWVDDLDDFTRALYHARAIHSYLKTLNK